MGKYSKITPPKRGSKITVAKNGQLQVPDDPIVPFLHGAGISEAIWKPCQEVFDLAVERCYANAKRLEWLEIFAGDKAIDLYGAGEVLPEDSIRAIQEYKVCIKGPVETPANHVEDDIDQNLRTRLDLYAHVQPVRYLEGVPSPLGRPHGIDLLIFRENTEDVYPGIEWKKGCPEAKQIIGILNDDLAKKLDKSVRPDSSIGIKAISATATKRLIRAAIDFSIKHRKKSVTFVHKASVMRHTEGFFRDWGYELARKEFGEYTVTEQQVIEDYDGTPPRGKVVIRDREADAMFQELLLNPLDYDVIATTNLNGHYVEAISLAAVGGIGLSAHAFVGAKAAMFEATHGLLPKAAPEDENPTSVLMCGVMLFDHLGWKDAAELVTNSLIKTIAEGRVTPDIARHLDDPSTVDSADFCEAIIENFEEVRKSRVRKAMKRTASGHALQL